MLIDTLRLGDPTSTDLVGRWIRADTRGLVDLMHREGGELWLYKRLSRLGLAETRLGQTDFWHQLERLARKTLAQNLLVHSHAESVIELLTREGIAVVPIKGVRRIDLAARFPFADCRATNDVDLLIPSHQRDSAWEILSRNGYRKASDRTPPGHYHLPPLADAAEIPVELHVSTSKAVPPSEAWQRGLRADEPTEVLWQGWMHGMDQGLEAFFLRYFLDAAVALRQPDGIDWDVITRRLSEETTNPDFAVTWLGAAAVFAGTDLPIHLENGVRPFALHRTYAWRVKAFRSRLRTPAWTRKLLAEALRCEFAMTTEAAVPSTPVLHRARRRLTASAARLLYRAWRRGQSGNDVGQARSDSKVERKSGS